MSDSEYEEEAGTPCNPHVVQPVAEQQHKPTTQQPLEVNGVSGVPPQVKKNERGAGRKKGNKPGSQKVSEFQQSKLMSETFKEYTDMLIMLKKELDEQKKTLQETINSEETKHKKDVKNAVQEAKLAFARTLTRH
jgi:ribosomal protein S18